MSAADAKKIKITLVKSAIARPGKHKAVLLGLGLVRAQDKGGIDRASGHV